MTMKTYYKILGVFSLIAALSSCGKNLSSGEGDEVVIDPNNRYIQFDSGVTTRGNLVTAPYLEANFAVLGYQYPKEWAAAISMDEMRFSLPSVLNMPIGS